MDNEMIDNFSNNLNLNEVSSFIDSVKKEISGVLVGQNEMVELLMAGLLTHGHVLIEGVPGMAKTLSAKLLSRVVSAKFSRIQFTPDLMPSDVTGTTIFNPKNREFEFVQGPIFANLILIDEINRAPAKTQSALFEVMEEKQVTVDGKTYMVPQPFMVIATQNPVEHEGTYRLPEAQLDRFMFKITINYPNSDEELEIISRNKAGLDPLAGTKIISSIDKLVYLRSIITNIIVDDSVKKYIVELSRGTRSNPSIYLGVSPRASIQLMAASQALAVLSGRDFATPDDVRKAIYPTFRHRIILSPEREMEGATPDDVIKEILGKVEVPR